MMEVTGGRIDKVKQILIAGMLLTLTASCGWNARPQDESKTEFFSVALIYSSVETSYLIAGYFTLLPNHTLAGQYFMEDVRRSAFLSSSKHHNEMKVADGFRDSECKPGPILLPYFMSRPLSASGVWIRTGADIQITPDSQPTQLWGQDAADVFVLKSVSEYHNAIGYAFLSEDSPVRTLPLTDRDLQGVYENKSFLQNSTNDPLATYKQLPPYPHLDRDGGLRWDNLWEWKSYSVQDDLDVRSVTTYVNDGASQYGQYDVARNIPGHSTNMLFEAFGHDFNNDGCFDLKDAGHSRLNWGVTEGGQVTKFLILESSYQDGGRLPILSVGYSEMVASP